MWKSQCILRQAEGIGISPDKKAEDLNCFVFGEFSVFETSVER